MFPHLSFTGLWTGGFFNSLHLDRGIGQLAAYPHLLLSWWLRDLIRGPDVPGMVFFVAVGLASACCFFVWRSRVQAIDLEQSRRKSEAILDSMETGIAVLDLGHNLVDMNDAAARLLGVAKRGLSSEEVDGTFEVFLPGGSRLPRDQWPSVLALKGEFVQRFEVLIRRKYTGKEFLAELGSAPIRNSAGEMVQIIITYQDVTELRRVDEACARLAAIVEFSEDAIIGKDGNGVVTSWNSGAEKIFGYRSDEMVGQSIWRLLPPELAGEEDDILWRIKRGETVDHIDSVRVRKDGVQINVSLSISPIKDALGKVIGASKIARDITEKRQLERQLRQSQKMEAIGQLTGGIAHDFNNLLGVIMGNLDLLELVVPDNEVALKRVGTAQKAAGRGAELTRRMLTFSSKEELKPRSASLNESIESMLELAGRIIGPEIKISTSLDTSVPPIFIDVAGLESALLNLVVNARDAMPKGGSLTITTQLNHLEESYPPVQTGELAMGYYACVSVSDTGHGMSREVLDHAFEPFFTTKPRGKGSGLGLAMVYGFVKQSGGTVRIYSEPNYGTTITFCLPLAKNSIVPRQALPAQDSMTKRTGRVLVVDDEDGLLEIATAYLEAMGYTAVQAIDAAAAIAVLESQSIDLMITDIMMPGGMNGVELAQKSRQVSPATKVIFCSGFPANALAERTMPMVDGPLLHKPYLRAEFSSVVRRVMDEENSDEAMSNQSDKLLK